MSKQIVKQKYERITEVKAQTDVLLAQLSQGEYRSLDTWANNLAHLIKTYTLFGPYMEDTSFLMWLNVHHAVMLSEIVMTGKAIMALQNFMKVTMTQAD
ncbi:hypothetical protein [Pantoea agglomerans]|uniref:hypothetical protein n=1 Tax=Enterobacter agglomerans TaxID=549 RepID=UPI003C7DA1DF